MKLRALIFILPLAALGGCAMTSDVMDTGNGTYAISSHASFIRGGATEATSIAYKDANKYCAEHGQGHAVVIGNNEREVYNSSVGGSWMSGGGSFGGGTFAAGNTDFHFRCAT